MCLLHLANENSMKFEKKALEIKKSDKKKVSDENDDENETDFIFK